MRSHFLFLRPMNETKAKIFCTKLDLGDVEVAATVSKYSYFNQSGFLVTTARNWLDFKTTLR